MINFKKPLLFIFVFSSLLFNCVNKQETEEKFKTFAFEGSKLLIPSEWKYYLHEGVHRFTDGDKNFLSIHFYPITSGIDAVEIEKNMGITMQDLISSVNKNTESELIVEDKTSEKSDTEISVRCYGYEKTETSFFDILIITNFKKVVVINFASYMSNKKVFLNLSNNIINSLKI